MATNHDIINELRKSYAIELETVENYLANSIDIAVIRGVIRAEEEAIDQYKKLIKMCDPVDLVTQDLILEITGEEQAHRRQFIGFLYEYERGEAKRLTAVAA